MMKKPAEQGDQAEAAVRRAGALVGDQLQPDPEHERPQQNRIENRIFAFGPVIRFDPALAAALGDHARTSRR